MFRQPLFARFPSRRSVVYSKKGIVASPQPLAAQAGLEILKAGGNAVDAAVATAAALCVTEPCSTGVGGDMFMLYWNERQKKIFALNGSGRSPKSLTIDKCRELGFKDSVLPPINVNSVTIPGQVAGWVDAVAAHGSNKVSLSDILKPAIELCKDGFPVSEVTALQWAECESLLKTASPNGYELLKDGSAPRTGQLFKNPYLGKVLEEIATGGKAGFYEGWVASAIVDVITQLGGVMTLDDLKSHTSTHDEPASVAYKDIKLWECPPNGQGLIALEALSIIDSLEKSGKIPSLDTLGHNSLAYTHIIIEALRYAFADGNEYIGDPRAEKIPMNELLNDTYLSERVKNFRLDAADATLSNGFPTSTSDTVYFTTSDSQGNACSFICSNAANFGCGVVPQGCGFPLQNRGHGFLLREGHLNSLKPNKRPYHTIMPAMVTKGDRLEMAYGVMGGFMQPQGHLQVLLNTLIFGYHPQDALDAPRICIRPAKASPEYSTTADHSTLSSKSVVSLEEGFSEEVAEGLRKMGHEVEIVKGWQRAVFGRGQIISAYTDPNGELVYCAGSDLRGDGHAVAW
ncbi:nucleophile aminohydrolase [Xylogone sp. PMI_703]|nr:nucleophile aminohydrolase [Xylogone sp. PMI_703]